MKGALEGLKVLDFSILLPGPYATMSFADMGADVLRITSASRFDVSESQKPFLPDSDVSTTVAFLGRNKRCMNLNLKDGRAKEIIRRLIVEQGYDIIVEQFRPGVMAGLGLAYEDLKRWKEDIIYCSISGYGQDGPMVKRAGHDINYVARSGLLSYSGRKAEGPPIIGMQIADIASGAYNAMLGILMAVVYRQNSGRGQFIDISMVDGMIAFNAFLGAAYLTDGETPTRECNFMNGGSMYDFYETRDGGHISFGGLEEKFYTNFYTAIGRPDLIALGITPDNLEQTKKEVRAIILTKTRDEWMAIFNATDACVEPVLSLDEIEKDELTRARELIVEVPDAEGRLIRQPANPIRFSETKARYRIAGTKPTVGAETREVLAQLGYTSEEYETFKRSGLFA